MPPTARPAPAGPASRAKARLYTAARCRFAEDRLADAVSGGIEQVVLAGSGFETFAAHNPYPGVRVFAAFGSNTFENALRGTIFDEHAPAFFIRLGAGAALTDPALTADLHYVAARAPGTAIVFDHAACPTRAPDGATVLGHDGRPILESAFNDAESERDMIAACLARAGLAALEDLGPDDLAERYLLACPDPEQSGPRILYARNRPDRPPRTGAASRVRAPLTVRWPDSAGRRRKR